MFTEQGEEKHFDEMKNLQMRIAHTPTQHETPRKKNIIRNQILNIFP